MLSAYRHDLVAKQLLTRKADPLTAGKNITRRVLLAGSAVVAGLGSGFLAGSAMAQTREGHFRVGILMPFSRAATSPLIDPLIEELAKLGYIQDQNLTLDVVSAEGDVERLPAMAAELVARNPQVVFTTGAPAAVAMKANTATIPIVFAGISDPVQLGIVQSLARPDANLTGFTINDLDVAAKRLQMLHELDPTITRVAALYSPLSPASVKAKAEIAEAGKALGIDVIPAEYRSTAELPNTIARAVDAKAQALITTTFAWQYRKPIIEAARERRLPVMYTLELEAADGGLISFGADIVPQYRRAATYIDRLLSGMKPSDLPVEQTTENMKLVINLKTAKELGLSIPPSLLARADAVIE